MAFVKTPSTHIPGITVTDSNLVIPLASIPQLVEAEVTDAAGDIRKVAFALAELLYQIYAAMDADDRPTNWTAYRSPGEPDDDGVRTPSYTNQFTVADSATEVSDEPA